jgi:predicted dehydrogenase
MRYHRRRSDPAQPLEANRPNYVAEIEDFQRAVATGGQPATTSLDGLRVVEVTLAMIESARTRRSVKIERVEP